MAKQVLRLAILLAHPTATATGNLLKPNALHYLALVPIVKLPAPFVSQFISPFYFIGAALLHREKIYHELRMQTRGKPKLNFPSHVLRNVIANVLVRRHVLDSLCECTCKHALDSSLCHWTRHTGLPLLSFPYRSKLTTIGLRFSSSGTIS